MRKSKLLIEKNLFQRLIDTFFKAKAKGKEDEYIAKIHHSDPEIAAAFKEMNDAILQQNLALKKSLERLNLDTTEVDKFIKKWYDKV